MADLSASESRAAVRPALLLTAFVVTIFLSAALLFAVQPMFAKMVLPRLGGAPSVWSVAMVFFQTALLAGYAYAHLLTRYAPGRHGILLHLALMIVAALTLPLSIAGGWGRPPASGEALWLIALFTVSIGLPFFALAANGPLLQAWFARSTHPSAGDPYFLYAASNVGSFLALISYPLAIEPLIRLSDQSRIWSAGFLLLIALIAGCGALIWQAPAASPGAAGAAGASPTWRDAARWAALAGVPAGLLVAVTAHISTDVAAVPLLWVLPLALYLLTFVIVFQRRPLIPHRWALELQPIVLVGLLVQLLFEPVKNIVGVIAIHAGAFFVLALVCHGELVRRRPPVQNLTAFYMWMSAGGMIGGLAAGLIAPYAFNWVAEYPILLVLAVLCRPGFARPAGARDWTLLLGGLAIAAAVLLVYWRYEPQIDEHKFRLLAGIPLALTVVFWRKPLAFAAVVGAVLTVWHFYLEAGNVVALRSFFTVHKVSLSADGRFRVLANGTTLHGAQRIYDESYRPMTGRPEIGMYYYDGSAMAQVMDVARARAAGPIRYAVVGLGAGTLACRAQPLDTVEYYEIDPAIIRIARNPDLFTFVSECRPDVPIMLGDARLTLAGAPDGVYDIIYVDAFSSDAIPIHLLTQEAMALYKQKLSPHGIVVLHVSNRHLELASVVAGVAAANGMIARVNDGSDVQEDESRYRFVGTVVAAAASDDDFGALAGSAYWRQKEAGPNQSVWTDDFSNILGAILRQFRE